MLQEESILDITFSSESGCTGVPVFILDRGWVIGWRRTEESQPTSSTNCHTLSEDSLDPPATQKPSDNCSLNNPRWNQDKALLGYQPYDSAIPLRCIRKRIGNRSSHNNCTWMFIAALFIIVKNSKQPKCPWNDGKLKCGTRHGVLIRATKGTNLPSIMLCVRSQTEKDIHRMIPFTWNVQNRQKHRDRK